MDCIGYSYSNGLKVKVEIDDYIIYLGKIIKQDIV